MKQVLQSLKTGETTISDVPAPSLSSSHLLVATSNTLISAGTERMLVDFGKANWLNKARQQPDKVRMVLDKVQTDGIVSTVEAVQSKLDQPLALGYCNVGRVLEMGCDVEGVKVGDRVASNGSHAEVISVPKNLAAVVPDSVTDEEASFTVLASIGLQGIRLTNPTLGECVVVTGLGLIGLVTVQLLRAQGCRVLGIDYNQDRLELAKQFGAEVVNPGQGEDVISAASAFSRGRGVDAVIITAATKSNEPVAQAATISRKRGRIILVGVTGLELSREDFYEKELSFQVSCSYGPGRYDPAYEEAGQDYPVGFVRWTEQRNFEAVLDMMASGQLDVKPLISHRFDLEEAASAYEALTDSKNALGIILRYKGGQDKSPQRSIKLTDKTERIPSSPVVGFIGAGNYASRVLIPAFKSQGAQFSSIVTSGGINSVIHGKKAGFSEATTDPQTLLDDPQTNAIAIVTRHDTHADFINKTLAHGKHVFVEKPLAITKSQVDEIEAQYHELNEKGLAPLLMVGFNRRFSPQVHKMKTLLTPIRDPKAFIMTVNAGHIPADSWIQDPDVGGGRIIGEGCHFIDLMRFLAGSEIISVQSRAMGQTAGTAVTEDKSSITLGFADGSFGTIHYLANGASDFPKERIEVFSNGGVLQLDNFRKIAAFGWPGFRKKNLLRQDKGQKHCANAFLQAIQEGTASPIRPEEIFEVARISIDAAEQLRAQE